MRLCRPAAPTEHSQCGFERRPLAVTVLPGAGVQGHAPGLRLEAPLSLTHESQVFFDVLVQHVQPSFHEGSTTRTAKCCA